MPRRKNDFYPTLDTNAIDYLIKYWDIPLDSTIFECCNGQGHLSNQLREKNYYSVDTGDIEGDNPYFDATDANYWETKDRYDFIITNPSFKDAPLILPLAYDNCKWGVAMLLRLSYSEPCRNRAKWLDEHPISILLSIPRISFTGDGKTDKVSTAWFVWDKRTKNQQIIVTT